MATLLSQLYGTNAVISGISADFKGLDKLDDIIHKTLQRLNLKSEVQKGISMLHEGAWSIQAFDGWFAPIVRAELGKVLGIVRNKAIAKARAAGAGSASTAVLRRTYRNEYAEAVHDLGNHTRISSRERVVPEPTGGRSGIRRLRTVSDRTKNIQKYYGPDRSFILRFLDGGTNTRTAKASGPTGPGSKATYGVRGSIAPRSFFHSLSADMEQAANQLGETLIGHVEKWTEQVFTET